MNINASLFTGWHVIQPYTLSHSNYPRQDTFFFILLNLSKVSKPQRILHYIFNLIMNKLKNTLQMHTIQMLLRMA